jgi:hypothetical protein
MFYNTVREFSNIVTSYSVTEFRRYGSSMSFVAKVGFIDGSVLFIKDYLFIDGKRKYSYHSFPVGTMPRITGISYLTRITDIWKTP